MAYDPLANVSPELRPLLIAMEDVLNSPPRTWDIEPMDVRQFRHDAYQVWAPLLRSLLAVRAPVDRNPEGGDGTAPSRSDESAVPKAGARTTPPPSSHKHQEQGS